MNQNNPETHALTSRCPLADAVRLRTLARACGITPSALVARLVHSAVADVTPSCEDLEWSERRRAVNALRRELQDERTRRGLYRKPGWDKSSC